MGTVISINEIEQTKAFEKLNAIQKSFAVKRQNRMLIQNALIVHKTTGVIPSTVFGYNLALVEEIILGESEKFDDAKNSLEPLKDEHIFEYKSNNEEMLKMASEALGIDESAN